MLEYIYGNMCLVLYQQSIYVYLRQRTVAGNCQHQQTGYLLVLSVNG